MEKRIVAYLIILGFLLGNILRFSVISPSVQISVLDISVIILYLISLPKISTSLPKIRIPLPITLFVFWLLFTLLINAKDIPQITSGFAYLARYCLYLFSFIPLRLIFFKRDFDTLIQAIAIVFPVVGAIQYLWFPDLRPFTIYGWDMHYYRVFGTYLDPGFFGLILIWSLLNIRNIYFWIFSYFIFAFTYSRSSFLAFLFSYLVTPYRFPSPELRRGIKGEVLNKIIVSLTVTLLVVFTVIFLPRSIRSEGVRLERTTSAVSRISNWQQSFEIFQKYPFFGTGFNLLRFQYQNKPDWQTSHAAAGSDSSFIFILSTSGIIGLLLYLNMLYYLWKKIRNQFVAAAFFIAILVHSFFLNSQLYPAIMLLFTLSIFSKADNST